MNNNNSNSNDNEMAEWAGVAAGSISALAKFNAWHEGVRGVLTITRLAVVWTPDANNNNNRKLHHDTTTSTTGGKRRTITVDMHDIETAKVARNNGTIQIFLKNNININNSTGDGAPLPIALTPLRREDGKIARKLINKIANATSNTTATTPAISNSGSPMHVSSATRQQGYYVENNYANCNAGGGGSSGNDNGNTKGDSTTTTPTTNTSQPRLRKHRRKLSKRRLSYRNANAVDPAEEAAEMASIARKYSVVSTTTPATTNSAPPYSEDDSEPYYYQDHTRNRRDGYFDSDFHLHNSINSGAALARQWRRMRRRALQNILIMPGNSTARKWCATHSLDLSLCIVALFALAVSIATLAMADTLTLRIRLLAVAVSSISSRGF